MAPTPQTGPAPLGPASEGGGTGGPTTTTPAAGPGASTSLRRSAAGVMVANLLMLLVGYVGSLLLARFLGAADRGVLGVMTSVTQIAVGVFGVATPIAVTYYASRRPRHAPALLGNGLLLTLALAVAMPALAILSGDLLGDYTEGVDPGLWVAASLMVPIRFLSYWCSNLVRARLEFRRLNYLMVAGRVATLVATVLLLGVFDLGLLGAIIAVTAAEALVVVGLLPGLLRRGVRVSGLLLRALLRYGSRVQAGYLIDMANARFDVLILAALAPSTTVGVYVIAQIVAEIVLVMPRSLGSVLMPMVARGRGDAMLPGATLRLNGLLCGIAVLVMAVLGPLLIRYGYGPEFADATTPFLIILPGIWFLTMTSLTTEALRGRGQPGTASLLAALVLVVTVVLDLLLIPPYGAVGGAIASAIAYTVSGIASLTVVGRQSGVSPFSLVVTTPAEAKALVRGVTGRLRRRRADRAR